MTRIKEHKNHIKKDYDYILSHNGPQTERQSWIWLGQCGDIRQRTLFVKKVDLWNASHH